MKRLDESGPGDALLFQITQQFYKYVNSGADEKKIMYLSAAMAILNSNGSDPRAINAARKLYMRGM